MFYLGPRHFGTLTAYVIGPEAASYRFTSGLPVQILKSMGPLLIPHLEPASADACLPPPLSGRPRGSGGDGRGRRWGGGGVPEGEVPASRVGEGRITGVVVEEAGTPDEAVPPPGRPPPRPRPASERAGRSGLTAGRARTAGSARCTAAR